MRGATAHFGLLLLSICGEFGADAAREVCRKSVVNSFSGGMPPSVQFEASTAAALALRRLLEVWHGDSPLVAYFHEVATRLQRRCRVLYCPHLAPNSTRSGRHTAERTAVTCACQMQSNAEAGEFGAGATDLRCGERSGQGNCAHDMRGKELRRSTTLQHRPGFGDKTSTNGTDSREPSANYFSAADASTRIDPAVACVPHTKH